MLNGKVDWQASDSSLSKELHGLSVEDLWTFLLLKFHFDRFCFPINNIEGPQVDFARLADWMSLKTVTDFDNLLERYEKFPAFADQVCEMLRLAVNEKRTNHEVTMVRQTDDSVTRAQCH